MCIKNNLSPPSPLNEEEKNKEIKQILKASISRWRLPILLKFGMWGAEGEGHLQYTNDSNSWRKHGATYAWK